MKAIITVLWPLLCLASQTVLAQVHQPAQHLPDLLAQSDLAAPRYDSSGSSSEGSSSSGASGLQSEAGAELNPAPSPIARLKPQTQGDVTYLCGGIGEEETSYMKREAQGYDLMLTFATQDGSYLADVNVDIRNLKSEPVLQTMCDSPILLVDLPRSGTYRIRAETAGYVLNQTAKVTAKEKRGAQLAAIVLAWPQQVAEAPAPPGATSSGGSSENENENSRDSGIDRGVR